MASTNKSNYIIAFTVIACSIGLLLAMAAALTDFGMGTNNARTVTIDMPSATGLRVNSQLRYAGAPVGKINSIEPIPWDQRGEDSSLAIRVTAVITSDMPELKTDSSASITADTLLAEKFLDLSPGSASAPVLADGQAIRASQVATFDDLTRSGLELLDELNEVVASLKGDYPDISDKIGSLLNNADNLAQDAESLIKRLDQILEDNEGDIDTSLAELRVVLQNLKVVSTYAKSFTGTVGQRPWRVMWGGEIPALPTEEEIIESKEPVTIALPKR